MIAPRVAPARRGIRVHDTSREDAFATSLAPGEGRTIEQDDRVSEPGKVNGGGCSSNAGAGYRDIMHGASVAIDGGDYDFPVISIQSSSNAGFAFGRDERTRFDAYRSACK